MWHVFGAQREPAAFPSLTTLGPQNLLRLAQLGLLFRAGIGRRDFVEVETLPSPAARRIRIRFAGPNPTKNLGGPNLGQFETENGSAPSRQSDLRTIAAVTPYIKIA
jgi:hypothetical protein